MNEAEYVEMSLRQLGLRPGIALQTQGGEPQAPKEEAHFLAAIDGKGVMVTHEGRTTLAIGSHYRVCGFTGQYDFHFAAPVLQTFDAPFAYALLAYPGAVRARKIRRRVVPGRDNRGQAAATLPRVFDDAAGSRVIPGRPISCSSPPAPPTPSASGCFPAATPRARAAC